jgi:hypothetical protein
LCRRTERKQLAINKGLFLWLKQDQLGSWIHLIPLLSLSLINKVVYNTMTN